MQIISKYFRLRKKIFSRYKDVDIFEISVMNRDILFLLPTECLASPTNGISCFSYQRSAKHYFQSAYRDVRKIFPDILNSDTLIIHVYQ